MGSELIAVLKKSLKALGSEGSLAAKALSLIWVTEGGNIDEFDDVCKILKHCIINGDLEVQLAAVHALGMIVFLEDVDNIGCNQTMFMLEDIYGDKKSADLIEACLDEYGLLYSKRTLDLDRESFNLLVDKHFELLSHPEMKVRISAGENIALFLEQHRIDVQEQGIIEAESYYERHHELELALQELSRGD